MRRLPSFFLLAILLASTSQQVRGDAEFDGGGRGVEKRSVSAIARMGQLPYQTGKRYVAALARNGELSPYPRPAWNKKFQHSLEDLEERLEEEGFEKRYLGALARAGDLRGPREEKREDLEGLWRELGGGGEEMRRLRLEALRDELGGERGRFEEEDDPYYSSEEFPGDDKRGGISSLAKGSTHPLSGKRNSDDELEELMSEVYGIGDKRSVASLARGSFLKSGSLTRGSKKDFEDEEDWGEYGEEKRSLPSLLRDRMGPLGSQEGKRRLGFSEEEKRNLASLARSRDFPMAFERGVKRGGWNEGGGEEVAEEMSKRYVAALLRQGRLPVGEHHSDEETEDAVKGSSEEEGPGSRDGSKADEGGSEPSKRKKKSVGLGESPIPPEAPLLVAPNPPPHTRAKRETFVPLPSLSGDYILPVLRGNSPFEDPSDKWVDDDTSPINKRYFAVRGGGKIPGGRLPQIGRRGNRHMNSGRRRH